MDIFVDGLERINGLRLTYTSVTIFSKPVLAVDDTFRFVGRYLIDTDTHQPRLNSFLKNSGYRKNFSYFR